MGLGGSLDGTTNRSRHSSAGESARPTTYFLTRDPEQYVANQMPHEPPRYDASPVRTLREAIDETDHSSRYSSPKHNQPDTRGDSRRRSTIKPLVIEDLQNNLPIQTRPDTSASPAIALTPLSLPSRDASIPSSPKSVSSRSLNKSDGESISGQEDSGSQAIASSDDEQEESPSQETRNSAPQLIMPSIRMPSRRPFTSRGKNMGKFKIMVAGSRGSGRTSLIKSIVQLCEDIVHVDPLTHPHMSKQDLNSQDSPMFNEIFASTKPYPAWWSEIDDSRILKRRKSMGDFVLERNICFIDTLDSGKTDKAVSYLEQQFLKTLNDLNPPGNSLIALLSGTGGAQVDLVLYLMTQDTLKTDCERIKKMSQLCNVIPLLAKADLLSTECISELKATLDLGPLSTPNLPPTYLDADVDHPHRAAAPYCISSANGPDSDNMDASLLMSPEYVQPLIASELALLVDHIFEPHTTAYLRHTSAKKIVTWYASEPRLTQTPSLSTHSARPSTLNSPIETSLSHSAALVPVRSNLSLNTSNSFALAKVADHSQREERLAQIRLSKWATDLQLSLQRERERYENIARNERALWLVQRMGEEIRDGQVIPSGQLQAMTRWAEKSRLVPSDVASHEVHDPLGLLRWQDSARTRGWIALQALGSFGVVGGVALWLAKTWGVTSSVHEWVLGWSEGWLV